MSAIPPAWPVHTIAAGEVDADQKEEYKKLSTFAAKGVAVISAKHGRWDHATIITDYLSVSYDPPTVLVSLYSLSRMCEALEQSPRWGLSLLADTQRTEAAALSELGSPLPRMLERIAHFRTSEDGPALIAGSLCWFELETVQTTTAATHTLFVGEVRAMGRSADYGARPLTRFQSGYLRAR